MEKPNCTQIPNLLLERVKYFEDQDLKMLLFICYHNLGFAKPHCTIDLITKYFKISKSEAFKPLKNLLKRGSIIKDSDLVFDEKENDYVEEEFYAIRFV